MDSFELNKIAGAVLAALLVAFGSGTVLEVVSAGHDKVKPGYVLPVEVASANKGAPAKKKGFEFAEVAKLLPAAKPEVGQGVFKKCSACHTVNEGGKHGQGPNLWEIVGRKRASIEEFKYSKALAEKSDGEWDYESLAAFIHRPKAWAKGTKMAFAGLRSNEDLAALLVYLRSLSASPKPLPAAQ